MNVGFSGTQEGMTPAQKKTFRFFIEFINQCIPGPHEFHHGDCIGADDDAHKVVRQYKYTITGHPPVKPDKRAYCDFDTVLPEKEYLKRNRDIAKAADIMIVTPKEFKERQRGSGTWASYRYAHQEGCTVITIWPDGNHRIEPTDRIPT
jgi:hypothetical protein